MSLSIKALLTLFSWNMVKLVFSECNFWIDPLIGFNPLVIASPTENIFVLLIPVLLLYTPE